jgi:ubiquinone/menaquinone biosynthesis C-methylase UbiE
MEVDWILRSLPAPARTVLDVGCGIGALMERLAGRLVIGMDRSWQGLSQTRRRVGSNMLACADAARLPLADALTDAVTCQHVIEHLGDCEAALAEWRRVLRPQGVLLVLTPNAEFSDPAVFDDETHVRLFSMDEMERLIVAAGFEVLDLRSLGLPWFRAYHGLPGGWRARRLVTKNAVGLSSLPSLRTRGQTLCCAARKV